MCENMSSSAATAAEVLRTFCDHTRMSDQQRADVTKIAQRYVALHAVSGAYAFVSSDYNALELRTYDPPLAEAYSHGSINVDTLKFICKNNVNKPLVIEGGAYEAFLKAVVPRPVGEEQWKTAERPDQWKELAYFLGTPAMVESIYHDPKEKWSKADNAEVYAIRDHMKSFALHDASASAPLAREIGAMISHIELPADLIDLSETLHLPPLPKAEVKPLLYEPLPVTIKLVEAGLQPPFEGWTLEALAPLEDFRKQTGLPVTVFKQRLIKQYLFSLAGVPVNSSQVKSVLGPHQKALPPVVVDTEEKFKFVDTLIESVSWSHFHPNESKRALEIARLSGKREWTAEELMKCVIAPEKYLNERTLIKYQKSEVAREVDMELFDAIANL